MSRHLLFAASALLFAGSFPRSVQAQINLTAGDVAIVGWIDNGSPADRLAIVALADIPAGARIHFTDNGWDSTAGAFRNTIGPHDGDGNEQLLLLTVVSPIQRGTIFGTADVDPRFAWTTSGPIAGTGVTAGSYAVPQLAQTGDQVTAFQHDTGDNALNTAVQQHLFVLDDTGAFETASSTATGGVPPGLSVAASTAVTFLHNGAGQAFMAFDTSTLVSGTKAEWLAAIADAGNWMFGTSGNLPGGTVVVTSGNTGSVFCAGDGSGAACPCANHSPPGAGEGCVSSLGVGGRLRASGNASLAHDTVVLTGAQMPNSSVLYFQGMNQLAGGAGVAFGDGLRCAGGVIVRLATKTNVGGASQYPGAGNPSVSAKGLVTAPAVRTYQCWYRNAAAFCSPSTFNLTNGLQLAWGP